MSFESKLKKLVADYLSDGLIDPRYGNCLIGGRLLEDNMTIVQAGAKGTFEIRGITFRYEATENRRIDLRW